MDDYLFKHVFELEFDGYLITSDLQMSSTNVTILEVARPAGIHFIDIVLIFYRYICGVKARWLSRETTWMKK